MVKKRTPAEVRSAVHRRHKETRRTVPEKITPEYLAGLSRIQVLRLHRNARRLVKARTQSEDASAVEKPST